MKKALYILITFLLVVSKMKGQEFDELRSLGTSIDITQIKEKLNYGLVFTGPTFHFNYRKSWELKERSLMYEGDFGFGPLSTRGMLGLNFRVKPVDLLYNRFSLTRKISVKGGPWFKMDYNYQLYPHLQSGYSFHFTNYTVGIGLAALYRTDNIYLRLRWKNSLFGLLSRTPEERDPYFFDLDIGTYFKDQHRDFKGGSFNLYNNTFVELLYVNPLHPRIGYVYSFEYFTYNKTPKLKSIVHNFSILFYPKT